MKKCIKCEETKALTEFSKYKKAKDGLYNFCNDCIKNSNTSLKAARYDKKGNLIKTKLTPEEKKLKDREYRRLYYHRTKDIHPPKPGPTLEEKRAKNREYRKLYYPRYKAYYQAYFKEYVKKNRVALRKYHRDYWKDYYQKNKVELLKKRNEYAKAKSIRNKNIEGHNND